MRKDFPLLEDRLNHLFHYQRSFLNESFNRLVEKEVFYEKQENKQTVINQLEKYANFPKDQHLDTLSSLDKDLEQFGFAKFYSCGSYGADWDY